MVVFICDDEKIYLNQMYDLVKNFFDTKKIDGVEYKLFSSGEDLLKCDDIPDFAFLDVEISTGLSGTYVGKKLKELNPLIKIFIVTAHVGYIDEAFRFSFFRFLTKPVNKANLFRNLNDAIHQNSVELSSVTLELKDCTRVVNVIDIMAVQVEKRGCIVYLKNGSVSSTMSITTFEKILSDSCFFRTHRDFIVNMRYVKEFNKTNISLKYQASHIDAYLSLSKYKKFKDKFLWYKERML